MNALSDEFHAAFVLYVKPYQETSALVETFCRDQGRVGMVFRRVRGTKSTKGALLQPFQPLWLNYSGHHELRSGRQLEPRGPSVWLTGAALISGLYLNELLVRLLHRDDPHPGLFDAYESTLQALATCEVEPCLRQFERRLLAELGYEINFDEDADGAPLQGGSRYRFLPEAGFILHQGGALQEGYDGSDLLAIGASCYDEAAVRRTAKRLFRQALAVHLGSKPLMSRALFNTGSAGR